MSEATTSTRATDAATTTAPVIRCRALSKEYGNTTAVSRLDLEVAQGEIFGLLGPNGAGKTTTILMLLGLTEPTHGSVRVLGLDPTRQPLEVKSRVGYLPDSVGFYGDLTGRENLRYTARLNGLAGEAAELRIGERLDRVGLTARADDLVSSYSRGMVQRLGIADALVKDPDVLILDEPTIALDPKAADQVLSLIDSLAHEHGVTVLLSSHLLTQVQAVCDRIGIFVRGRLVAAGTIDELAAEHGGRVRIEVEVADERDPSVRLRQIDGVVDVRPTDGGWLVGSQEDVRPEVVTTLQSAGYQLLHLRRREEELGQIYRRYFTEDTSVEPSR